ncbi:hypothetical protein CR513_08278, partial [Mucuna pruriens]
MVKADSHVQVHAETILAKEDQKQAKTESISAKQGKNRVPFGSDFSVTKEAKSYSHLTRTDSIKRSRPQQPTTEIMSAHLVLSSIHVGQLDSKVFNDNSSSPPSPTKLKPLPSHLKYAYLDTKQQLPIMIANYLHQEQEDKLLQVLRQHKKAIGWKLSDLRRINPSICMHRILMEEEAKLIRKQ